MPGAFVSCLGGGDRSPIRLPPPPRPAPYTSNGHHLAHRAQPPPQHAPPPRPIQEEHLGPHGGGAEEQEHHAPHVAASTAGPVNAAAPQHAAPEPEYSAQAPPLSCPVNWTRKELLAAGAFGQVYLGYNNETGQMFAVKQVPLSRDEGVRSRVVSHIRALESEVDVLRQLRNIHIVQYIGTEKTTDTFNIFQEYVSGGSIAALISKVGALNENVVRVYTKQILLGLEYLHQRKIMHRDVKGANILVDQYGTVKLADFGASKKIEDLATIGSVGTVEAKSIKGTPYWMAPEVIKQTGHGRPADIWSLGCCVIEMATGQPPWSNHLGPVPAMWHVASTGEMPPLPEKMSADGIDFLKQCFNRMPRERPNATRLLRHPWLANVKMPNHPAPSPSHSIAASVPAPVISAPQPASPSAAHDLVPIREEGPEVSGVSAQVSAQTQAHPAYGAGVQDSVTGPLRGVGTGAVAGVSAAAAATAAAGGGGGASRVSQQLQYPHQFPQQQYPSVVQHGSMHQSFQQHGAAGINPSMLTLDFNPMHEPSWAGGALMGLMPPPPAAAVLAPAAAQLPPPSAQPPAPPPRAALWIPGMGMPMPAHGAGNQSPGAGGAFGGAPPRQQHQAQQLQQAQVQQQQEPSSSGGSAAEEQQQEQQQEPQQAQQQQQQQQAQLGGGYAHAPSDQALWQGPSGAVASATAIISINVGSSIKHKKWRDELLAELESKRATQRVSVAVPNTGTQQQQ